jgi:regulatory protein
VRDPSRGSARRSDSVDAQSGGHPEDPPGDPQTAARIICLRLLDSRARSRAELETALRDKGIPDARIVLDRYREVGLIDDQELARAMVADRHRERGLGRRGLLRELDRRGIDPVVADSAVSVIDRGAEWQRASELVRKRLPRLAGVAPVVRDRRLVGLLLRKGYDPGLAYDVIRAECAALADDPTDRFEPDSLD